MRGNMNLYKEISDKDIYRGALALFRKFGGKAPIRLIGVKVSGLERFRQLSLFADADGELKDNRLNLVKDKIRDKYGSKAIGRGSKYLK